jgi:hypothetical protein
MVTALYVLAASWLFAAGAVFGFWRCAVVVNRRNEEWIRARDHYRFMRAQKWLEQRLSERLEKQLGEEQKAEKWSEVING